MKQTIFDYTHEQHVRATFVRLLKRRVHYDKTETYTIQVNIAGEDYSVVMQDEFWPENIICRDYVPKNRRNDQMHYSNGGRHYDKNYMFY